MIADPHKQQIPPLCCATVGMTYFRTPGCIEITRTGKSKGKSRSPFGDDNKKGKSNTRTWLRDGIHPTHRKSAMDGAPVPFCCGGERQPQLQLQPQILPGREARCQMVRSI